MRGGCCPPPSSTGSGVPGGLGQIRATIELADGRVICSFPAFPADATHWVACGIEPMAADDADVLLGRYRLADDPADVLVYGTSLAFLLDAAMDSGGDIAHLETGRLEQFRRFAA